MIGSSQLSTCPDKVKKEVLYGIFNQLIIRRKLFPVSEQGISIEIINMGQRVFLALFKVFPSLASLIIGSIYKISRSKVVFLADRQHANYFQHELVNRKIKLCLY